MAFDVTLLTAWTDEIADRSQWVVKPILGARTMDYIKDKRKGISGYSVAVPTFESTAPAQAGSACGFNTSGTTTIGQITLSTSPIKVNEEICIQNLETYFTQALLPDTSRPETFQLVDLWVNRKLAQISKKIEQTLWQAKTTYGNDTWLKQMNGYCHVVDNASDEITATAAADITTSNVLTIVEEMIFSKLPSIPQILDQEPIMFMGQDTFMLLQNKLLTSNLYHYTNSSSEFKKLEMYYPGTTIKIVAVPGLNASNTTDAGGSLPAAVQDRIFLTYADNLMLGYNAENDASSFDVWYSKDDDVLRLKWRAFLGVQVKHTDLVITYKNS